MITIQGVGITAGAGTKLVLLLFLKLFSSLKKSFDTMSPLVKVSFIAKISRLLHPVGLNSFFQ